MPVGCLLVVQVIELPLKHPELFDALGIAQPKVRLHVCIAGTLCYKTWLGMYGAGMALFIS
jgi:ATP-dependent 26S proteasome regulatory subunit